jgi:hypothetical protein
MSSEHDRLGYALAKQVPAMANGFSISTSYGDIEIGPEDAALIVEAVRTVLRRQVRALESVSARAE